MEQRMRGGGSNAMEATSANTGEQTVAYQDFEARNYSYQGDLNSAGIVL
jgi:hypothetical protein